MDTARGSGDLLPPGADPAGVNPDHDFDFLPPEPGVGAGDVFQSLAAACLFIYATSVLLAVWPVGLLQAEWQIRFAQALISPAPLALLGLGFAHLAAYLDPDEPRLQERLLALRRWSVVVALAFLLLVPLQLQAFWGTLRQDVRGLDQQRQDLVKRHRQLREGVLEASSPEELARTLARLQGPQLTQAARDVPLAKLQQELLRSAEAVKAGMGRQIKAQADQLIGARLRLAGGLVLSAVALGLSFAACAQRRFSRVSLLQEWLELASSVVALLTRSRSDRRSGRHFVESDYFEALSFEEADAESGVDIPDGPDDQLIHTGECRRSAGILTSETMPEALNSH